MDSPFGSLCNENLDMHGLASYNVCVCHMHALPTCCAHRGSLIECSVFSKPFGIDDDDDDDDDDVDR